MKYVLQDKNQECADICDREWRGVSDPLNASGLGLLSIQLDSASASAIAPSIVMLNLGKMQGVPARLSFL
jgi:hypothetical protein